MELRAPFAEPLSRVRCSRSHAATQRRARAAATPQGGPRDVSGGARSPAHSYPHTCLSQPRPARRRWRRRTRSWCVTLVALRPTLALSTARPVSLLACSRTSCCTCHPRRLPLTHTPAPRSLPCCLHFCGHRRTPGGSFGHRRRGLQHRVVCFACLLRPGPPGHSRGASFPTTWCCQLQLHARVVRRRDAHPVSFVPLSLHNNRLSCTSRPPAPKTGHPSSSSWAA